MCRLLCVKSDLPFRIGLFLPAFAEVAQSSSEYQGHGWGCAWRENGDWRLYHSITPIWTDQLDRDISTTFLLAHARSAFENQGIAVENNMPFCDGRWAFAFNGELRGVRLTMAGRIGAEKIFNLVKSRNRGDMARALTEALRLLEQRTAHLKAANFVISDGDDIYLASRFIQNSEYYTMWRKDAPGQLIICSEPFRDGTSWRPISQGIERLA